MALKFPSHKDGTRNLVLMLMLNGKLHRS